MKLTLPILILIAATSLAAIEPAAAQHYRITGVTIQRFPNQRGPGKFWDSWKKENPGRRFPDIYTRVHINNQKFSSVPKWDREFGPVVLAHPGMPPVPLGQAITIQVIDKDRNSKGDEMWKFSPLITPTDVRNGSYRYVNGVWVITVHLAAAL